MRKYYADFPKEHVEVTKGFKIIRKKTQLQLHQNSIFHLSFLDAVHTPHLLVTASADKTCRVVDLEKECAIQELGGAAASLKRVKGLNSGS